jgi:uncharacterized protein YraI/serine/threonine protein kinase
MSYHKQNGQPVILSSQIGSGGEAIVFSTSSDPNYVAKIYHQVSPLRTAKLQAMVANPPTDPTRAQGHISIVWPTEIIYDPSNICVGLLMPRIDFAISVPMLKLYNPKARVQKAPNFTWEYLLHTAKNLASVVEAVHVRGYVIGDLNESNLLVSNSARVTIVDCDSMQVSSPSGQVFLCTVGKGEYLPPELQGANLDTVVRNPNHDNFALAILIFMLLMEGTHPFDGRWHGTGNQPSREENIQAGRSPHVAAANISPPSYAPPFNILPPQVQALMIRCFGAGHYNPSTRPTPGEWQYALESAEQHLAVCKVNDKHRYSQHLTSCPWCDRMRRFRGHDPFPKPGQQSVLPTTTFNVPVPVSAAGNPGSYKPPATSPSGTGKAFRRTAGLLVTLGIAAWVAIPQFTGANNTVPPFVRDTRPTSTTYIPPQQPPVIFPTDTPELPNTPQPTHGPDAIVRTGDSDSLILRPGPGIEWGKKGLYVNGTKVRVFGRDSSGVWFKVEMEDGETGWVMQQYLQINIRDVPLTEAPPDSLKPDAVVNTGDTDRVILRPGPSKASGEIKRYVNGTRMNVFGRDPSGVWLRVEMEDGQIGWVMQQYLIVNIQGIQIIN